MEALQRLIKKLFLSRAAAHSLFCLAFIAFFFFPVLANGGASRVLGTAFIVCFFFLGTTYAGRWACKKWLLKNKLPLFFINILILIVVLTSMISLFIYLEGLQKQWEALTWGTTLVTLFLA